MGHVFPQVLRGVRKLWENLGKNDVPNPRKKLQKTVFSQNGRQNLGA